MKLPQAYLPGDLPGLVRQLSSLWAKLASLLETVDSGSYTPTVTGVANVTTVTASPFQWKRVGNTVTVSGRIDVAATAGANTMTQVGVALPIAGNIANGYQVVGGGSIFYTTYQAVSVYGDATNQRAQASFNAGGTGSTAATLHFTYLLTP
jgi:hypothetical protein